MNEDKIERSIQFILESQAHSEAAFEKMREEQAKMAAEQAKFAAEQARAGRRHAELRGEVAQMDLRVGKAILTLTDSIDQLATIVNGVNEHVAALDSRVDKLAATVDNWIRNQTGPNGNPSV